MKKLKNLFIISCLLLAGCKSSNAPVNQSKNDDGSPSATLRLFLISSETPGKPITYTAGTQLKNLTPIEEKMMSFLKKHRNVTIEVTTKDIGSTPPMVRSMCFQESSDMNFDIMEFTPHQADICSDKLLDLSPFIETDSPAWKSGDYRVLLNHTSSKGRQLLLPSYSNAIVVAYNKKIFSDLGVELSDNWSWKQFADITTKLRDNGYIAAIESSFYTIEPTLYGLGGSFASGDPLKTVGNLDSESTIRAVQQMFKLPVEWKSISDFLNDGAGGQLGLVVTSARTAQLLIKADNFSAISFPTREDGKPGTITLDRGLAIPKASHNAKLAWELLHHLVGDTDDTAMSFVADNTLRGFRVNGTNPNNFPLAPQLKRILASSEPSVFHEDLWLYMYNILDGDIFTRILQGEDIAKVLHESAKILDDNMEAFYKN